MIKKIKLTNFRKFKNLDLDIDKNIVVFYGNNAQGKSSILESIYLITNGKSPWTIETEDYVNTEQIEGEKYTRIMVMDDDTEYSFYKSGNKRLLKINNSNTIPSKFFANTASVIFSPEQIEILMISSTKRRDFLDEIISTVDYTYIDTLKNFRKVLKQRNAYLKKLAKKFYDSGIIARNDPQLNFWTQQFVDLSKVILEKRQEIVKDMVIDSLHLEYIKSNGSIDLEEAVENAKRRDIATGCTNIGPHRDDWNIIDGKNIKKFGSRGEKRLAIGKLIFKKQEIIKKILNYYPILLLDDIASELDQKNTEKIFNKEIIDKQQTFIAIINKDDLPKDILDNAQLFNLNDL